MSWYRVHELIARIAEAFCRHPEGIVCPHRQYEYDWELKGWYEGHTTGRRGVEAKWRGSVTGKGPYAGYPPPLARESE